MYNFPFIIITPSGMIASVNESAAELCGIPVKILQGTPLLDHVLSAHQTRFESELNAIVQRDEMHGRVHLSVLGLDEIARKINMTLSLQEDGNVLLNLSGTISESLMESRRSNLADPHRLLPVARRITSICRRAQGRDALLFDTLAVMAEALSATGAASIDWGATRSGWPVTAMFGDFTEMHLKGIFRASVIGRLKRGDVIVKEATMDGTATNNTLILVPLMAADAPEGVMVLHVNGYTVLGPQENQGLLLLGELIGMGVRMLAVGDATTGGAAAHSEDAETAVALGRLAAGLAHEITNAVTVLRNNTEQISTAARRFARNAAVSAATEDSLKAIDNIRDITFALRSFAPEEIHELEHTDPVPIIRMVLSVLRFYAKRGIDVHLNLPDEATLTVQCRRHYLVRALFLLFVGVLESAAASSRSLGVDMAFQADAQTVDILIAISAGTFNIAPLLQHQLEPSGVLAHHVRKAGAEFHHDTHPEHISMTWSLPRVQVATRSSDAPPSIPPAPSLGTRRGTILIVDDEPAIVRSTRRLLEHDHDVLAASSGHEALELIKQNPRIDVILLDVFMPGMTGLDICEHLRRQNSHMADRLIFITGGATDQDVAKYLVHANCPVIEKPIDTAKLNALIAEIIGF
ncbi:MAG: response regulator [Proteobacteria bacterium]|nr:response regulator [Pseudomonadota bacterium]